MSNTEQHLKRIQEKLQLLLKEHTAVVKENKLLKEELSEAKQKVTTQQKSVDELKQQVSILKVSTGEMSEADKKDFEKRSDGCLEEIARCISMLGQ